MKERGLEVIESSVQKTPGCIAAVAKASHLEKSEAFKTPGAALHTLRNCLRVPSGSEDSCTRTS